MRSLIALSALLFCGAALEAQDNEGHFRVIGSATVEVAPDHARLALGVRIQADTPESAAEQMSRRIDAIVDTLAAMGIDRDSLPTQVFGIQADRNYQEGAISGYTATTTLRLTTFELSRIAEFLSAAIAKGATEVGGVEFKSTEERSARALALREAVHAAREDAEVLAEAAGETLGDLVEVSNFAQPTSGITIAGTRWSNAMRLDQVVVTGSAITPQLLPVNAQVVVTWKVRRAGDSGRD